MKSQKGLLISLNTQFPGFIRSLDGVAGEREGSGWSRRASDPLHFSTQVHLCLYNSPQLNNLTGILSIFDISHLLLDWNPVHPGRSNTIQTNTALLTERKILQEWSKTTNETWRECSEAQKHTCVEKEGGEKRRQWRDYNKKHAAERFEEELTWHDVRAPWRNRWKKISSKCWKGWKILQDFFFFFKFHHPLHHCLLYATV